jgi:hypothetical protein
MVLSVAVYRHYMSWPTVAILLVFSIDRTIMTENLGIFTIEPPAVAKSVYSLEVGIYRASIREPNKRSA